MQRRAICSIFYYHYVNRYGALPLRFESTHRRNYKSLWNTISTDAYRRMGYSTMVNGNRADYGCALSVPISMIVGGFSLQRTSPRTWWIIVSMQKAVFTVKTSKDNDSAIQFRPRITVLNMQKRNASLNRWLNMKMRKSPNANANLTEFIRLRDVVWCIWRHFVFTVFFICTAFDLDWMRRFTRNST